MLAVGLSRGMTSKVVDYYQIRVAHTIIHVPSQREDGHRRVLHVREYLRERVVGGGSSSRDSGHEQSEDEPSQHIHAGGWAKVDVILACERAP